MIGYTLKLKKKRKGEKWGKKLKSWLFVSSLHYSKGSCKTICKKAILSEGPLRLDLRIKRAVLLFFVSTKFIIHARVHLRLKRVTIKSGRVHAGSVRIEEIKKTSTSTFTTPMSSVHYLWRSNNLITSCERYFNYMCFTFYFSFVFFSNPWKYRNFFIYSSVYREPLSIMFTYLILPRSHFIKEASPAPPDTD
jgi:hypothetical protein